MRLIETDDFQFEFVSLLGEKESWRKEIHRPTYHVHKWWAKRLGSVFRSILLGCQLSPDEDLTEEFYASHRYDGRTVLDPFMGSGTTVGEAHKLGFTALGRDINPVAVEAVRVAHGPLSREHLLEAYNSLEAKIGEKIKALYRFNASDGNECEVLYYFWVMQAPCNDCGNMVDLFRSYVFARHAYPKSHPEVQIVCPTCSHVFEGHIDDHSAVCPACCREFRPKQGPASRAHATCPMCSRTFAILAALKSRAERPRFRMYAKLVLTQENIKRYLPIDQRDIDAYASCSALLKREIAENRIFVPQNSLEEGVNTNQALSHNFKLWSDFFNDRQLLALGWLRREIMKITDTQTRDALALHFSGTLEFNNLFASYKGEGTGAVRHMFSHHILKPERCPIEANVWGTAKSSGSFSNLFTRRLLRLLDYRVAPTELVLDWRTRETRMTREAVTHKKVCSPPFSGDLRPWPRHADLPTRAIALSCGDSACLGLPDRSVDLVVTDPPFFDNVHYSELADFFYAWGHSSEGQHNPRTTRHPAEVQDTDPNKFAEKLKQVFIECHRVLKDDGLLVFTYHHSRSEGWTAIAKSVLDSGFVVVNTHPVKGEMAVAAPKSQSKNPINFDIILVCRKWSESYAPTPIATARKIAESKLSRLEAAGFHLSVADRQVVLYGQLLTAIVAGTGFPVNISTSSEGRVPSSYCQDAASF